MSRVLALYETDRESTVVDHSDGGRVLCRIPAASRIGGRMAVHDGAAVVRVDRGEEPPLVRVDLATGAFADAAPPVPAGVPPALLRCRAHPGGVLSAIARLPGALWLYAAGSWAREPLPPSFDPWDVAVDGDRLTVAGGLPGRRPKPAVLAREGTGEWTVAPGSDRAPRWMSTYHLLLRHGTAYAAWGTTDEWGSFDGAVAIGGGEWRVVRLDGAGLAGLLPARDGAVAVTSRGDAVPVAGGPARPVPGLVAALAALPGDDVFLHCVRGDADGLVAIVRSLAEGRASTSAVLVSRDGGETAEVVATAEPGTPRPVDVALAP